jgi:hypothetical protein
MQGTNRSKQRAEERDEDHEGEMYRTRRQADQKQKWDDNGVHTLDMDNLDFGRLDDGMHASDNLAKTSSLNRTLRTQKEEKKHQPGYMGTTSNTASRNERNRVHGNEHHRLEQQRTGDRFDQANTHHASLAMNPGEELRYFQEIRNIRGATSQPSQRPDRL